MEEFVVLFSYTVVVDSEDSVSAVEKAYELAKEDGINVDDLAVYVDGEFFG